MATSPCRTEKIESLIIKVSVLHDVPKEKLIERTKNRQACLPREIVWYICKHHHRMSCRIIADYFNGRNTKTVWKGVYTIANEMKVNNERRQQVESLIAQL